MEVICNISMRWRSWGVSTRRCERLVVSLTDIPVLVWTTDANESSGLLNLKRLFEARRGDYNLNAPPMQRLRSDFTGGNFRGGIFRRDKAAAPPRLPSKRAARPNGRCAPRP